MRSPRLTRDEWVLLLDLYLRRRPRSVAANDPELLALSALLSRRLGLPEDANGHWRSPDGLRARMSVFRVLDPYVETPDTKRSALAAEVWEVYAGNPSACTVAAQAIREALLERRPERSPRLDADEWTLLLNLFVSVGRRTLPGTHSDLARLSTFMRRRRAGPTFDPSWRSADGLRREMTVLQTLELGLPPGKGKRADAATAVWRRYADDPQALAAAVRQIEAGLERLAPAADAPGEARGNPSWSEDETLLALDAYLAVRPRFASPADPAIVDLSRLLKLQAQDTGLMGAATFRNPAGVARKVNKFRAAEAGRGPETVKGAQLEAAVWRAFETAPGETLMRVAALRQTVLTGQAAATAEPAAKVAPSRGPTPMFGPVTHDRSDGQCAVYVMVLTGPVSALYPDAAAAGMAIIKVGRTNDLLRRAAQHNQGFPPGSGLAWRPVDSRMFASAVAAHDAERALLDRLYARGLTLGGEFARVPAGDLQALLDP